MIEATGATRHIYTAAAVAVRHEMTPDTLATRQDDTAVGGGGGGCIGKKEKQTTFSAGSPIYENKCPFYFPLMLQLIIPNTNGHCSERSAESVASLNVPTSLRVVECLLSFSGALSHFREYLRKERGGGG